MVIRVFMCLIYLAAYLFSLKPEHQGGFGLRSLSLPDAPPAEKGVGKRGGGALGSLSLRRAYDSNYLLVAFADLTSSSY